MIEHRTRNYKFRGLPGTRRFSGGGRSPGRGAGVFSSVLGAGLLSSVLRTGSLIVMMIAILSCSDSPDQYSPLGDNDGATAITLVSGTVVDKNAAAVARAAPAVPASASSAPTIEGASYTLGAPGQGGRGGQRGNNGTVAQTGLTGISTAVYP